MLPNFIITFRETLEATLIIGIILSYLAKTKQMQYNSTVYLGSFIGILASVAGALFFSRIAGGFTGEIEEVFEGVTMIIAASLLTTMIVWMIQQKDMVKSLRKKIASEVDLAKKSGIFFLILFAVLREGIEIVLFLSAANLASGQSHLIASLSGVIAASIVGYLVFNTSKKINLQQFFKVSTIVLILFAAGLFAHGIHEFQEAAVLPTYIEHVWDVNHILNEKGQLGGFMKDLFGYNGNPSLIEVSSYIFYLTGFWLAIKISNKNS